MKATSIADAADKFGLSDRAIERHIATHPRAPAAKAAKRAPQALRTSPQRERATSPARRRELAANDDGGDDEEAPATSRSPATPATARANAHRIAQTIDRLLERAHKDKEASYQDVSSLARAALSANRQLAQLTGEWGASDATVASSPHFKRLLGVILEALRGDAHADARRAVIEALEHAENGKRTAVAA